MLELEPPPELEDEPDDELLEAEEDEEDDGVDAPPEPEEALDDDELSDEDDLLSDFLLSELLPPLSPDEPLELEYRSLYQPPPFSMNAVWLMRRSTASLPHLGQVLIAASVIFCHSSKAWLQAAHWYS